ncbi:bifunctional RNase H/acid phosphatase [Streptomyces dangxiongensis]|uniref:Bifunctional RNase H/acid phosphatase n=1 Tax=Streptomyces dangxiongensis TaxID=1442032 RepID=A0A3G2JMQ6_9ACTN|nr:bifunctional RNase H/acid phosphatase [Streptomyces dangxiongensis]AYN41602.1 bifunctional RNase H/acid phosphatase [Streptomyces dangxiongensis]
MREFIVEADGGSRGNPGPAGYGAVVCDAATGQTLAEAAEYIGVATNNVAEYRGLLAGLRAAHALDPSAPVHVRMDSKLVVEQMSGRWKIKHPAMKPLAAAARSVFPPDQVTYEWIPREQNKHADRLANEAMDAGARGEQWSPPPQPPAPADTKTEGADTATSIPAAASAASAASVAPAAQGASATPATRGASAVPVGDSDEATSADAAPAADAVLPAAAAPDADAALPAAADAAVESRADGGTPAPRQTAPSAERRSSVPGDVEQRSSAPGDAERRVSAPGWSAAPDLGAPATFVLLRHGETPLTPQKRFSGSGGTDPSLSGAGREQARRVAEALARRGTVQAVVASPLARTRETAAIVAARLGLDVTLEEGLRETDFGAWEGLTFGEVRDRYPDDLNAWLADPEAHPTGGGESFADTAIRIAAARDELVAAHAGRTVLLVTHVTPIKTLIRLALGAPAKSLFRMELSAASLSAVAYYADGNASVRLFNDTSHLRP